MNAIKMGFTDAELLTYGTASGFEINEFTSLFDRYPAVDISQLKEKLLKNLKHKAMLDYLVGSFMDPGSAMKVIGIDNHELLGFRAALPKNYTQQTPYAILFSAGDRGLMMTESREYLDQVLLELSGHPSKAEKVLDFQISQIEVLVFLAACDVMQQNGSQERRFTETSLFNAYNVEYSNSTHPICSALAAVAGDVISSFFTRQKVTGVLQKMVENRVLLCHEEENEPVYSLSPEYHYIPMLFEHAKNKLAMLRYEADGRMEIILTVSDGSDTWAFELYDGEGRIERLNEARQHAILFG